MILVMIASLIDFLMRSFIIAKVTGSFFLLRMNVGFHSKIFVLDRLRLMLPVFVHVCVILGGPFLRYDATDFMSFKNIFQSFLIPLFCVALLLSFTLINFQLSALAMCRN